jgi:hypothetical protein
MHVREFLKESSLASTTKVAPALDENPNVLISDGDVQVELGLRLVFMKLGVSTVSTTRRRSDQPRLDVKVVFTLIYRENAILCQSQDIQKKSPLTCL